MKKLTEEKIYSLSAAIGFIVGGILGYAIGQNVISYGLIGILCAAIVLAVKDQN
ncbi:MAG: hypothetical protein QF693_01550 [Pelagibacteraceae bacterium]|jgi:uncharacterized membrane protein YgaE (UPF0421/DUF939 family)|nr:hypothetical protein [Pelagibacteraceae bacterium]|tara:strand:+ start:189 stop:350 length:162 start_codon:yes stop_codon:yes gene_type:complete